LHVRYCNAGVSVLSLEESISPIQEVPNETPVTTSR
jgi:hypothetical protein